MKILSLILLLLFLGSAKAQQPYYWQITDEDGLPTMSIYELKQDNKGYIWIGTDAGVCKYNGLNIRTYLHPKQKGNSMSRGIEDAHGRTWFKNFNGQLFFLENDSLKLFPIPDSIALSPYFVYNFFDNKLWINAKKGIYYYSFKQKTWTCFVFSPKDNSLNTLSALERGEDFLLLHTIENKVYTISRSSKGLHLQYKTTIVIDQNMFRTMVVSRDSFLVIGPSQIFLVNSEMLRKNEFKKPFFEHENILGVFVFSNRSKIIATTTNGVFVFEKNAQNNFVLKHHLLSGIQVSSAFLDREGNAWFGTLNNGIFVFPNLELHYFNSQNSTIPSNHIYKIIPHKNNALFLALSNGTVVDFSTDTLGINHVYNGNNNTIVTSVVYDSLRKKLLFYNNGFYAIDLVAQKQELFTPLIGGHRMTIFQDSFLLIGNTIGSSILKLVPSIAKQAFEAPFYSIPNVYEHKDNPYPFHFRMIRQQRTNVIFAHKTQPNKFWIGYDDSLFCYHQNKIYPLLTTQKASITSLDMAQCEDGFLWVATISDGIYAFREDSVVYHFTTQNGLPSNTCYTLTYHENSLWGGTNKGIFKIDLNDYKILIFNKLDGLLSEEIKDIEILNNYVWAATTKGLISFHKNLSPVNQFPPLLQILSVQVGGKNVDKKKAVVLNYNENDLKFLIEGINLRSRGNFSYQYRLLGLDSNWISLSGASDFIRFQALTSGEYEFQVKMQNEDGIVSTTQSFRFSILTPYWQRWWFQLFLYLLVAGVVALVLTLRNIAKQKEAAIRSQMSQLKMQALQSQLNPHFVFNAMSAIQSYWLHKQSKEALLYHSKFAKLIRSIFDFSSSLSIHIQDEIAFLQNYIALEKLRFEDKVEVHFDIDESILEEEIYLAPLLIQPLVENCFKHAFLHKKEKGNLFIQLKKQENQLYILIQDDGVGRVAAQEHKNTVLQDPNRLSSMKIVEERLQILTNFYSTQKASHQPIKITDLKDENGAAIGTKVEVWIPIQGKSEN